MNITYYHWGIHGWIVYSICGAVLGLVAYRKGGCYICDTVAMQFFYS